MAEPLEWKANVDERAEGLRAGFVLGVVEEVALAGLVGWMPLKNVEVWVGGERWRLVF